MGTPRLIITVSPALNSLEFFPLNSKPGRPELEDSRLLCWFAQEGRGPVMGAGRGKDQTKFQRSPGLVPGSAGGRGAELRLKPGEAGVRGGVLVWGS